MSEPALRLASFAILFAAFALWEWRAPDRPDPADRRRRWPTNVALAALGTGLVRLIPMLGAVGAAISAERAGFGLFNLVAAPAPVVAFVAFAVLDLSLYIQHRLLHAAPLLWRLHAPHHADPHLDVTTGLRFHPFELAFSAAWKALVAALLGAPAAAVAAFEIALNGFSMFTHANGRLPPWAQRLLGAALVTPRAHRLHHDRAAGRTSCNYGFSTNLWDRLFGTWRDGAEPEHLGIEDGPDDPARLGATLRQPLR